MAEELADTIKEERRVRPQYGSKGDGYAVTEAPRGLLAYNIKIDPRGVVTGADIITPTAMFLPMMEADVERMAASMLADGIRSPEEIGSRLETVVRAYDPCVSCSVHVTRVSE